MNIDDFKKWHRAFLVEHPNAADSAYSSAAGEERLFREVIETYGVRTNYGTRLRFYRKDGDRQIFVLVSAHNGRMEDVTVTTWAALCYSYLELAAWFTHALHGATAAVKPLIKQEGV